MAIAVSVPLLDHFALATNKAIGPFWNMIRLVKDRSKCRGFTASPIEMMAVLAFNIWQ